MPLRLVADATRVLCLALTLGAAMPSHGTQATTFSPRPAVPRLAPVGPENRTEAQKAMLANRADVTIFKTLAHHPDFYIRAWVPLSGLLFNGSSLPPREREIVTLRMSWL